MAAAIAFRNDPSPEYSQKWLPDIQRGVEIWADLCAKVGRRCEDWDPLHAQATSGKEVGWVSSEGLQVDLVVGDEWDVLEELEQHSEDDLGRLVLAVDAVGDLLASRLPSNDYTTRDRFYLECGPALVLDVLALRSIVDVNLARDRGSHSGAFHYWCEQCFYSLAMTADPCSTKS